MTKTPLQELEEDLKIAVGQLIQTAQDFLSCIGVVNKSWELYNAMSYVQNLMEKIDEMKRIR